MKDVPQSIRIALSAIAGKLGLKFVFKGSGIGATDGKTVCFGDLGQPKDDDTKALLLGVGVHEGGHCAFTDFKAGQGNGNRLLHSIANIIEDIWTEQATARRWPGAGRILGTTVDLLVARGRFTPADSQAAPADVLVRWLVTTLRSSFLPHQDALDALGAPKLKGTATYLSAAEDSMRFRQYLASRASLAALMLAVGGLSALGFAFVLTRRAGRLDKMLSDLARATPVASP